MNRRFGESFGYIQDSTPPKDVEDSEAHKKTREIRRIVVETAQKFLFAAMVLGVPAHFLYKAQNESHAKQQHTQEKTPNPEELASDALVAYLDSTLDYHDASTKLPPLSPQTQETVPEIDEIEEEKRIDAQTTQVVDLLGDILQKDTTKEKFLFTDNGLEQVDQGDKIYYDVNNPGISYDLRSRKATQEETFDDGSVRKITLRYADMHFGEISLNQNGTYLFEPIASGGTLLINDTQELATAMQELVIHYDAFHMANTPSIFLEESEKPTDAQMYWAKNTLLTQTQFLKELHYTAQNE